MKVIFPNLFAQTILISLLINSSGSAGGSVMPDEDFGQKSAIYANVPVQASPSSTKDEFDWESIEALSPHDTQEYADSDDYGYSVIKAHWKRVGGEGIGISEIQGRAFKAVKKGVADLVVLGTTSAFSALSTYAAKEGASYLFEQAKPSIFNILLILFP